MEGYGTTKGGGEIRAWKAGDDVTGGKKRPMLQVGYMFSYPIIYLDLAANVIGKIGSNSSICIYNQTLMMGSLSLLRKLYQFNFQLQ